jgi:hypothetical protein
MRVESHAFQITSNLIALWTFSYERKWELIIMIKNYVPDICSWQIIYVILYSYSIWYLYFLFFLVTHYRGEWPVFLFVSLTHAHSVGTTGHYQRTLFAIMSCNNVPSLWLSERDKQTHTCQLPQWRVTKNSWRYKHRHRRILEGGNLACKDPNFLLDHHLFNGNMG